MYPIEMKQLLDVATCIIIVLDKEGVVQLVNKRGCELLGYEKGEIEGRNWFCHFVPEESRGQKLKGYLEFARCGCDKEFSKPTLLQRTKATG